MQLFLVCLLELLTSWLYFYFKTIDLIFCLKISLIISYIALMALEIADDLSK